MLKLYSLIEAAFTWFERVNGTKWGARVIALILSALLTGWTWATTNVPPALLVTIGVLVFAAFLFLQERGIRWIQGRLRPTVAIQSNSYVIRHNTAGRTEDQRRMRYIQGQIHILNTSTTRRVSLVLDPVTVVHRDVNRKSWSITGGLSLEGVRLNLAPEDETEGVWTLFVPHLDPLDDIDHIAVVITDRLTKRHGVLRIPGEFPDPGHWKYRTA